VDPPADVLLTRQGEPKRYALNIRCPDDLVARVVRSSSGTVRVPELGALVEPGPASEALVSNVEGVLIGVRDVVEMLTRSAETAEQRRRAEALLGEIEGILEGRRGATLILDDPLGNSAILSSRAEARRLIAEEVQELKTGMYVLDVT
jgi:zinc finger protein